MLAILVVVLNAGAFAVSIAGLIDTLRPSKRELVGGLSWMFTALFAACAFWSIANLALLVAKGGAQ